MNEKSETESRPLTQPQRLSCLIGLLDDVIKRDKERSQGEWMVTSTGPQDIEGEYFSIEGPPSDFMFLSRQQDASFIASASVSHGRNAKALKDAIQGYRDLKQICTCDRPTKLLPDGGVQAPGDHTEDCVVWFVNFQINSILSLYPDEILKQYLK